MHRKMHNSDLLRHKFTSNQMECKTERAFLPKDKKYKPVDYYIKFVSQI